ncbi:contactin-6-like isoform X3 [Perca fluviatilis]|uniref:contactin-6-like isoform X3 n=1 Tax=Perca fluviatilis TaxID=8168 RepID=UPI00196521E4|nr:contactin-6-like isoform X3 [Perca fluviatilis]
MQNGFIFLLIIWNSSPFSSEHSATNHLQFSLGCQAVIPCQDYRSDLNSLTWNYKKDEHHQPIQIYFQDKNGVQRHQQLFRSRMKVSRNGSLVIDHFTEDDQGLYSCEKPYSDTVITVKKEILKETGKTVYVIAGTDFTHVCPGELANLKWTFKASNMTTESDFVTSNKSIHIVNVKRADAGKYTCWKSGCNRHMQKLLTINLCVITAFPVHLCCWGLNSRVEEETSVVYSSVVIRKPAKTTNNRMSCDSSCVYSEIKVQRTIP